MEDYVNTLGLFEFNDDILKCFQKAVDEYIPAEGSFAQKLRPMPSNNEYADYVQEKFYSNTVHRVVNYGSSSEGRYIFYLFRSKDNTIYNIWTRNGICHVI